MQCDIKNSASKYFPDPAYGDDKMPSWGKERINEILWELLPPQTTLAEAENIAIEIHNKIRDLWESKS